MSLFLIITLAIGIVLISLPVTFKPDKEKKGKAADKAPEARKIDIDHKKEAA